MVALGLVASQPAARASGAHGSSELSAPLLTCEGEYMIINIIGFIFFIMIIFISYIYNVYIYIIYIVIV